MNAAAFVVSRFLFFFWLYLFCFVVISFLCFHSFYFSTFCFINRSEFLFIYFIPIMDALNGQTIVLLYFILYVISPWPSSSSCCRFGLCEFFFCFVNIFKFNQLSLAHGSRWTVSHTIYGWFFFIIYGTYHQTTIIGYSSNESRLLFLIIILIPLLFEWFKIQVKKRHGRVNELKLRDKPKAVYFYFIVVVKLIINNTAWDLHINCCLTLLEENFFICE